MALNRSDFVYRPDNLQDVVRYRVEQEVSIRLNRTLVNNTTVKTDYTVKYNHNAPLFYSVHVDDHISKISPDAHQTLLDIVREIDIIKSNVDLLINADTGKPETLKNHHVVINAWNTFKEDFLKKNDFIRAEESRQGIQEFVAVFDEQIHSCDQLLAGLNNQIFFNTFFDYYLVHTQGFESDLRMNYHSQLFKDIVTPLLISQKIIQETPESVTISKTGVPKGDINETKIKEQYDEKYRPVIEYQFSEYQPKYNAQVEFNTEKNYIEYADIRMNECVKNNVEMDIHCRIWRIQ